MTGARSRYPNQKWSSCPCGKRGFFDRKTAKIAARIDVPSAHMGIYQCDQSVLWHYGNLPSAIISGESDFRVSGRVPPGGRQ